MAKKGLSCPKCGGTIVAYQESYSHFRVDAEGSIGRQRIEVLEVPDETRAVCTECSSEYRVVSDPGTGAAKVDLEHPLPGPRPAPRRFSDEFKMRILASVIGGDTEILAREGIPQRYVLRWLAAFSEGQASRQTIQSLWRENQGLRQRMRSIKAQALDAVV